MQRSVALLAAALTAGLLALTPCKGLAQDFSVANAINNRGDFAGGSLLDSQAQFDAYIVSHGKSFDIGTFGGPASLAFAINELGETVGQSDTSETDTNGDAISLAFLVDRKGVHNLGTLPGFKHSQAFSINNAGLVAGWSYNLDPVISGRDLLGFQAFVYRGGRMTAIGDLGGGSSAAFGVNDLGAVVGRARLPNGEFHAFLFFRGAMRDLGTLGGTGSTARAVNLRWQAVGDSRTANGERHAALFHLGRVVDLGTLGGATSVAHDINAWGQTVGEAQTTSGDTRAFLYDRGRMRDLGTLGGGFSVAFGINDRGDVVGEAETPTGDVHAFLFRRGVMIDVDNRVPH